MTTRLDKRTVLLIPPTCEEIRDYLLDPETGTPLPKVVVERMTERALYRNAELHGERFEDWLYKQRTGK